LQGMDFRKNRENMRIHLTSKWLSVDASIFANSER